MKCPNCHHEVNVGSAFCGNCGASLVPIAQQANQQISPVPQPVFTHPQSPVEQPINQHITSNAASPLQSPPVAFQQPLNVPLTIVNPQDIPEVRTAAKATTIASLISIGLLILLIVVLALYINFTRDYGVQSLSQERFRTTFSNSEATRSDLIVGLAILGTVSAMLLSIPWVILIILANKLKKTTSTAAAMRLSNIIMIIAIALSVFMFLFVNIPFAPLIIAIFAHSAKEALAKHPIT